MIQFSVAILNAVADWLAEPPIFYLFALVCFMAIITIFLKLTDNLR